MSVYENGDYIYWFIEFPVQEFSVNTSSNCFPLNKEVLQVFLTIILN